MDCRNCELKQRQFYCTDCLRTHTRDFRVKTQHFAAERDEQVAKGTKALDIVEGARVRRASVAQIQGRVDEVLSALARLRRDNDKKRDRLRTLRESNAARRRTLAAANGLTGSSNTSAPQAALAASLAALANLSSLITRARAGLVQELVEVFNVVEVGGRPPIGGKAGARGEWTIGDLILPVPGDVRRYPPQHINAVLGHAVHFLGLLAWYLGVKLPFAVRWAGGKLGVGVPWIGPQKGGWGRWTASHPLHLSLSSSPAPASPILPAEDSPPSLSDSQYLSNSVSQLLGDSTTTLKMRSSDPPTPTAPETPQFTTALAMLLYDVLYLAHTQGLAIPLAQAGDVLGNLWAVCCSPELGRRSHASAAVAHSAIGVQRDADPHVHVLVNARLAPPTASTFPVDFGQVLQAVASGGGRRAALTRNVSAHVVSENRDGASGGGGEGGRGKKGKERKRLKPHTEEEEGWDIVSEDGY
ncbi:UV radiation resistance protein and autophagy-related subunit 14-domain-containing protein [Mycena capillaripes]|nr:UV radiation resistance protein and autophagy-related subunit 14-domain-containing protein [Mycena capillaripes]